MDNCLRQIRRAREVTQEELARAVYATRQSIIAIEKGRVRRPSDELMVAIARYFGLKVEDIFFTPLVQHVLQQRDLGGGYGR